MATITCSRFCSHLAEAHQPGGHSGVASIRFGPATANRSAILAPAELAHNVSDHCDAEHLRISEDNPGMPKYACRMLPGGRLVRALSIVLLILCAPAFHAQVNKPSAEAPVFAEGLGKGTVSLDGPWQFHIGDDATWSNRAFDDSQWEQISAEKPWGEQGHRSYQGYAWYRLHLHLKAAPGVSPNFSLLIPQIDNVYQIYWNGALFAQSGRMPPYPSWRESGPAQVFDPSPLRDGVLALRIWSRPLFSYDDGLQGGIVGSPLIGSPAAIADHKAALDNTWLRHNLYFIALQALYAALFALSMLVWLRDRSLRVLLWMAVFCGGELATSFLEGWHVPITFSVSYLLIQPALAIRDIGVWFLLLWLLKLDQNHRLARATRILAWIYVLEASIDGLFPLFDLGAPQIAVRLQVADAALTLIFVIAEMYPLILLAFAVRKRLDPARWAVAVFAFIAEMVEVFHGTVEQGSRFTHWALASAIRVPLFTIYGNSFSTETLADTTLLLSIIYAVYRYTAEEQRKQAALEQEYRNARAVQQVLIPNAIPEVPGFAIDSFYQPAGEVGGDFFQLLATPNGGVLAVIGDVSGKGMPAAMTVSLLVGTVRTLAHFTQSPAAILAAMNQRMLGRSQGGFTTCLVLRADAEGALTIANAGHIAPYIAGKELLLENGLPLGLSADSTYTESTFQLPQSQQLTLLTDGVVEAREKSGALFGFERTAALSTQSAEAIAAAAQAFGQEDDITVLTLAFAPAEVLHA